MTLLGTKSIAFSSKRVVVQRSTKRDGRRYNFETIGPEMSFSEIAALRARGVSLTTIDEGLGSAGHIFANMGVSAALTMDFDGQTYLLTVRQDRRDFGDSVAKLVSGYVSDEFLLVPKLAMHVEIAEEVLPVARDGRLVRFAYDGRSLDRPFGDHFEDSGYEFTLAPESRFDLLGLGPEEGIPIDASRGEPVVYFHAPTNSAQLVFRYHLHPEGFSLGGLGISLQHSEDGLVAGELETHLHPEGIYLVRLQDGDLTDYVATMVGGELRPVDPRKVVLSEAFAPKERRIVTANNITLEAYLAERS